MSLPLSERIAAFQPPSLAREVAELEADRDRLLREREDLIRAIETYEKALQVKFPAGDKQT